MYTSARRSVAILACLVVGTALSACSAPAGGAASSSAQQESAGTVGVLVFRDVNVIPMDRERVLTRQALVVRDGRIVEIGPDASVSTPAGATVVNGSGRYLIPGIAEMHAHIPPPQQGQDVMDRTLFLFAANGVTTIRGMLGNPAHLDLRERAARNEIIAPRIYTSGPSINGNSAPTPQDGVRLVREQRAAGYDLLKLHPGLSRDVYDAVVDAARREDMPFAGHVSAAVGLDRTLDARQASIDHLDAYIEALAGHGGGFSADAAGFFGFGMIDDVDTGRIGELAARTRAAGVWNAPTQTLIEHLFNNVDPDEMARWPEMRYMPEATVGNWVRQKRNIQQQEGFTRARADRFIEVRRQVLRELHAAGAGLILASDAPQWWNVPGYSLQHEMGMMVAAGLTPYQVLETATRNPARYFGTDEWGTIAIGKVADMILLEANPLNDIGNMARIGGVVLRGRWLPGEEIQRGLDDIAAAVR